MNLSQGAEVKYFLVGGKKLAFAYFTQEAIDWYDPLKPYTQLEYDWVLNNVHLQGQRVFDGGCHHGNYSIILAQKDSELVAVDCVPDFCEYAKFNLDLNGLKGTVKEVTLVDTIPHFGGGYQVIKLDVEGQEFKLLPGCLRSNPNCHTWIVEIHPGYGNPNNIIAPFLGSGFEVLKVNRERMAVLPYESKNDIWPTHATIIARERIHYGLGNA